MSAPESVLQVAERLGVPLADVQALVVVLCEQYGPDRIVVVPGSMRRTTLTPFAAECIAERALAGAR